MTMIYPSSGPEPDPYDHKESLRVVKVAAVHAQSSRPGLVSLRLELSRRVDEYDVRACGARPVLPLGADAVTKENVLPDQVRRVVQEMNARLEEVSESAEELRDQARQALAIAHEGLEELNRDLA